MSNFNVAHLRSNGMIALMNTQLGERERTVVFRDLDSERILGFGPELLKPVFPAGVRYTETVLTSALEIEKWVKRYREQQERDAEEKTYRQLAREKPIRDSIKAALNARSSSISAANQALNRMLIRLMDERYDAMMRAKAKPEVYGMAEAYDESHASEDIALENPLLNLR